MDPLKYASGIIYKPVTLDILQRVFDKENDDRSFRSIFVLTKDPKKFSLNKKLFLTKHRVQGNSLTLNGLLGQIWTGNYIYTKDAILLFISGDISFPILMASTFEKRYQMDICHYFIMSPKLVHQGHYFWEFVKEYDLFEMAIQGLIDCTVSIQKSLNSLSNRLNRMNLQDHVTDMPTINGNQYAKWIIRFLHDNNRYTLRDSKLYISDLMFGLKEFLLNYQRQKSKWNPYR